MSEKEHIFRPILIKDKAEVHKFECCVTWKNRLYIGTSEGSIMVFSIQRKNEQEWAAKGEKIQKTPHQRPIQQMVAVADLNVLLVLVGGIVQQHHLDEATEFDRCQLPSLRECSQITVKKERGKYIIAALTRKKILLYDWKDSKNFLLMKELNIVEGCYNVTWCGKSLLLGIKNDFVLLDTKTCALDDLFETERSNCPVSNMAPMKELMIAQESAGVRVTLDGMPNDPGLTWASLPSVMAYQHPYLLSVHDGNSIDIHCPFVPAPSEDSGIPTAQTLTLKYVNQLSVSSYVNFDAYNPEKNPGGYSSSTRHEMRRDMLCAITTVNSVFLIDMISMAEQAKQACVSKRFDHALRLCNLCPGEVTPQEIMEMRLRYGLDFFQQKKYPEAMEQFSEGNADPRFVASLLPGFLPQRVEASWSSPFGKSVKLDVKDLTQGQRNGAIQAIVSYLLPMRRPPSPPPPPTPDASSSWGKVQAALGTPALMSGDDDDTPKKTKAPLTEDEKAIQDTIDTALLRAYVELGRDLDVVDFLQKPNHCVVQDSELLLKQRGEYVALVLLQLYHREYKKVLTLCRQLGMHGGPDAAMGLRSTLAGTPITDFLDHPEFGLTRNEYPKTLQTQSALDRRILDFLQRSGSLNEEGGMAGDLQQKMERQFIGIMMTIHALKIMPAETPGAVDMLTEFSRWVLANVDPGYSLEVFKGSITMEPRDVLKMFKEKDMQNGLVMPAHLQASYLEMVLGPNMNANDDVELHNKRIQALVKMLNNARKRDEAKSMLGYMLRESEHYEPALVITFIGAEHAALLADERATVYRKMGDHSTAINMYVNEVHDLEAAKKYATEVSQKEEADAFQLLLKHLLHPSGEARSSRLPEALDVVNYCPGVDARTALPMLPPETPLVEIKDFLIKAVRETSAKRRSKEVYHNVLRSLELQTKVEDSKLRKKSVMIDTTVLCKKCNRKIADAVFARYPNGVVVHQACVDSEYVNPVNGKDFRRTAMLETYH